MKLIILLFLILCPTVSFAQQNLDKLFDKRWKIAQSSILRPNNQELGDLILYSRTVESPADLDNLEMTFRRDGTQIGIRADGQAYSKSWTSHGANSILMEGDRRAANITKLTDTELVIQVPQTFTSQIDGREEFIIAQEIYTAENTPLPVLLKSFAVKKLESKDIFLTWETTIEVGSSHFIIEHSNNEKNFIQTGSIPSKGKSEHEYSYYYVHSQPVAGINYYRLKMVDKDGSHAYSTIQSVEIDKSSILKISPNPVDDRLVISIDNLANVLSMKIVSLEGKEVYNSGPVREINMIGINGGSYVLIVEFKTGEVSAKKFTKI